MKEEYCRLCGDSFLKEAMAKRMVKDDPLCRDCYSDTYNVEYLPTEEEIQQHCKEIRSTWSKAEELVRRVGTNKRIRFRLPQVAVFNDY